MSLSSAGGDRAVLTLFPRGRRCHFPSSFHLPHLRAGARGALCSGATGPRGSERHGGQTNGTGVAGPVLPADAFPWGRDAA